MIDKKMVIRLSNELGNQMFMYASALGISKKLNRLLLIDNETAYASNKNISRYGLNNFKITSKIATKNYKFLGMRGYITRKILKKIDTYKKNKKFFIEPKDDYKITGYNNEIFTKSFSNTFYIEGYFETQKYFIDIKDEIINEFNFNDMEQYKKSPFYAKLNNENSVSICVRQNRFSEGKGKENNSKNLTNSLNFRKEQISYINKSINFFKNKINNPIFYLWSNNFNGLDNSLFIEKINKVIHTDTIYSKIDKRGLDLFLLTQCRNHIVIPSSFNWWGAWLSQKKDKIVLRPSNSFFSLYKINNKDFWPEHWIKIQ